MPFAGNTDIETTVSPNNADILGGPRITLTEDGYLLKVHGYRRCTVPIGSGKYRYVIYDENGLTPPSPVNYKGETVENTYSLEAGFSWHEFEFAAPLLLAKGTYYVMAWGDDVYSSRIKAMGVAGNIHWQIIVYGVAPDPFVSDGSNANTGSLYVEYRPTPVNVIRRKACHGGI